ncbi:MAG: hypothetical protein MJ062_07490 [Oscillospiraceae bacterium]|nr:hypothetical protein [Oscillospiraceae bacterium]
MRKFTKQITSMLALVTVGSSSCALMNNTSSASAKECTVNHKHNCCCRKH